MDRQAVWSWSLVLGRHVLAFVIFWVVSLALVRLGERVLGGWPALAGGQLLASLLGVAVSLLLRAPVTAYCLAALAAFSASELAIHVRYGIHAPQGEATHLAIMCAAIVGVAFGALLMRRGRRAAERRGRYRSGR